MRIFCGRRLRMDLSHAKGEYKYQVGFLWGGCLYSHVFDFFVPGDHCLVMRPGRIAEAGQVGMYENKYGEKDETDDMYRIHDAHPAEHLDHGGKAGDIP